MKKISILFLAVCFSIGMVASTNAATIDLVDWGFNTDGEVIASPEGDSPVDLATASNATYDASGFDFLTGLGSVDVTVTGAGSHAVVSWFDHEIDWLDNTPWNETGSTTGSAGVGQTWEIDEPGWVDGDIYEHLQDTVAAGSFLDDSIGASVWGASFDPFGDDISVAMGWDISLLAGQTATVSFLLSETAPTSGFYLTHHDPDSLASIHFSSSVEIIEAPVPEPSTVLLLGLGMAGLVATRKRWGKRFVKS